MLLDIEKISSEREKTWWARYIRTWTGGGWRASSPKSKASGRSRADRGSKRCLRQAWQNVNCGEKTSFTIDLIFVPHGTVIVIYI